SSAQPVGLRPRRKFAVPRPGCEPPETARRPVASSTAATPASSSGTVTMRWSSSLGTVCRASMIHLDLSNERRASVSPAWTPRAMPRSPGPAPGHATGSPPGSCTDVSCGRIPSEIPAGFTMDPPAGDIAALTSPPPPDGRDAAPACPAHPWPDPSQPPSYCSTYSAGMQTPPAARSGLATDPDALNVSQY